jgi:hypothetical protein|tara:strand:- start:201 stop:452 length:252 start_codon:yes stop_codon:yes gene_type:complete
MEGDRRGTVTAVTILAELDSPTGNIAIFGALEHTIGRSGELLQEIVSEKKKNRLCAGDCERNGYVIGRENSELCCRNLQGGKL